MTPAQIKAKELINALLPKPIHEWRDIVAAALESSEGLLRQAIDALRALQRQALQSSVNDGNEWGQEALEMTRTVLALAKDRGL